MLLTALVPCLALTVRGSLLDALAAVELAAVLVTLSMLLLAEGYHRSSYFELALILAAVSFVSSLVFVRLMARWL